MKQITASFPSMNTASETIGGYTTEVEQIISSIRSIRNSLSFSGAYTQQIQNGLDNLIDRCSDHSRAIALLGSALAEAAQLYQTAEKTVLGNYTGEEMPGIEEMPLPTVPPTPWEIPKEFLEPLSPDEVQEEINYWDSFWDYIGTAVNQIVLGNFTDDSNLLGIIGSVLVGITPVGWICDGRDVVADIYNLFEDGPETSEWIMLAIDVVAFIPVLGDGVKHSGEFLKNIDHLPDFMRAIDDSTDIVRHFNDIGKYMDDAGAIIKGKWGDVTRKIGDSWDDITDGLRNRLTVVDDIVTKADDFVDASKQWLNDLYDNTVKNSVDNVADTVRDWASTQHRLVEEGVGKIVDEFPNIVKETATDALEVKDKIVETIADGFDSLADGFWSLFGGEETSGDPALAGT